MTENDYSNDLSSMLNSWTQFKSERSRFENELGALVDEFDELHESLVSQVNESDGSRDDLQFITADLKSTRQELTVAKSEIERLQRQLVARTTSDDKKMVEDLVRERSLLNAELHDARQQATESQATLARLRQVMDDRQGEFHDEMKKLRQVVERQSELLVEFGIPQNEFDRVGEVAANDPVVAAAMAEVAHLANTD